MSIQKQASAMNFGPLGMPETVRPQIVCVLGMHRSGTSLVSGTVNLLGVFLGAADHLMKPKEGNNPTGFWENELLTKVNDELLSALGGSWYDPPALPEGWQHRPQLEKIREAAIDLIQSEFGSVQAWGWKDPRTCLTLPFWQVLLPPVQYVICLRNPLDVARSLLRRDGFPLEKGVALWLAYTKSALEHTAGCPRHFLFYEDFVSAAPRELQRLGEFLGRSDMAERSEVQHAFKNFVDQELHHHTATLLEAVTDPHVGFSAQALQLALRHYVELSRQKRGDHTFEKAIDQFSRNVFEAQEERDRLTQETTNLRAQQAQLAQRIEQSARTLQAQQEVLTAKEAQLLQLTMEREQLTRDSTRLRAVVRARDVTLDAVRQDAMWKFGRRLRDFARFIRHAIRSKRTPVGELPPLCGHVDRVELVRVGETLRCRVRGWCCARSTDELPEIQIVCQGRVLDFGYPNHVRPDISEAFDMAEYAVTGFDFTSAGQLVQPPSGSLQVVCEAGGLHEIMFEQPLEEIEVVDPPPLQVLHNTEVYELAEESPGEPSVLRVSGWVVVVGQTEPAEIELRFDGAPRIRIEATTERPDVAEALKGIHTRGISALPLCGFSVSVPTEENVASVQLVLICRNEQKTLLDRKLREIPMHEPPEHSAALAHEATTPSRFRGLFGKPQWVRRFSRGHPRARTGPRCLTAYDRHVENNQITPKLRVLLSSADQKFVQRPKISVLMPVYNVDPKWLRAAVDSVKCQMYPDWELCIADDASSRADTVEYLRSLEGDERIKVVFRNSNGHICAASNSAAELATGEFIALLDNDDVLAPHALFEIVRLLQKYPDADLIYSDEDKIDRNDRRYDPQFKPDWSPEMLLAYNYVNHFTCLRRELFEQVGGFRVGYEGSQDYDVLLRAVCKTNRVHHIPKILYHWRALPSSTAASASVKPIVHDSGRAALEDHLRRLGIKAEPYVPEFAERLNLPINLLDWPDTGPSVAIIIPTHNNVKLLRQCIESILHKTTYTNYRIVVVDNDSDEPATLRYLSELLDERVRVEQISNDGGKFSFSRVNNLAVQCVREDFVLFLNNDTEVIEPKWLSRMVGYLGLPGVGATGARLLFDDDTIQHGGVVLGLQNGVAPGHAFIGQRAKDVSYYFQAEIARPCAAVTGACLLTRRDLFLEMGGLDEQHYAVTMNDVDYCLRLAARGLRAVYVGGAELLHHESKTRSRRDDPGELAHFRRVYGNTHDRFYSPNLSNVQTYRIDSGCQLDYEEFLGRPVRTLLFTHNLNPEGAPKSLHELAVGLKKRGHVEPIVVSPAGGVGQSWYRAAGIEVRILPPVNCRNILEGWPSLADYKASVGQLQRVMEDTQAEVVVANTLNGFYVVDAATRAGVPAVWIIRESYDEARMRNAINSFAIPQCERALAEAYRVVFVSADTMRLYERYNRHHNFVVVPNGLDARRIDEYVSRMSKAEAARLIETPAGKKIITTVGTICQRKDQATLAQAIALIKKERDDFCCYMIGLRDNLSYARQVKRIIHSNSLEDVVKLIPETDEVRAYYRASDIFVFTSHIEAFSRTILEAEAFGLPIVTTPCCGIHDQVRAEVNAFVYHMSDAAALARYLVTLLDDEEKRLWMGRNSRKVFECLVSYDEMIGRYERLVLGGWMRGPLREETRVEFPVAGVRELQECGVGRG